MTSKKWTFRLDDETRKLLDRLADEQRRSRANVIKTLIHAAAKQLPQAQTKKRAVRVPATARKAAE